MSTTSGWVVLMVVESGGRPGIVEWVGRTFAERGISLSNLLATTRHGRPVVAVHFEASERLRDHLVRRLQRSEEVLSVTVQPDAGRPPWAHLDSLPPPPPDRGEGSH